MSESLKHRGPDDSGYFEDSGVSMGAQRLSIIDIAGGHQPLSNEDESVWLVYNGEIYNFRSLRDQLVHLGHRFQTATDSETVVHAYEEFDLAFPKRLAGMFAIALWDSERKRLILARDRVGMKPLYYVQLHDQILFASEIKALLTNPEVSRFPDKDVLRLILAFGYSPDERTPFNNIMKLPPAVTMVCENGSVRQIPYWDIPVPETLERNESLVTSVLKRDLRAAVVSHMVSDVPLGVMLSGGLDSSIIAMLAKEAAGERLRTFTFRYDEEPDSADRNFSTEMAEYLSSDHREIVLDSDDLVRFLPLMMYHHDEPKVDAASIPTLATALHAKKSATVVLVGEGADEQFGGYYSHLYFARTRRLRRAVPRLAASPWISEVFDEIRGLRKWRRRVEYIGALNDANLSLRIMNSPVFTDWDLKRSLNPGSIRASERGEPGHVYEQVFNRIGRREEFFPSVVDLKVYIPNDISMKIDKMMMAGSVEARLPFLDTAILDFTSKIDPALKISGGISKYLLRRAFADRLPKHISGRPKQTIRVPLPGWIRTNLDVFEQQAEGAIARGRSPLSREAIRRITRRARAGDDADAGRQLFALAIFEVWYKMYIDPDTWKAESSPGMRL